MNFDLGDIEKGLKKEVRRLFSPEAMRQIAAGGQGDPRADMKRALGRILPGLKQAGYCDSLAAASAPGAGPFAGALAMACAGEEIAALSPSLWMAVGICVDLFGWLLARFGNDAHREKFLEPLMRGELVGTVALHEHTGSFDAGWTELMGARKENGWAVSGLKRHVALAPAADVFAVVGDCEGDGALFLVEAGKSGVTVGGDVMTAGFSSLPSADVRLQECLVENEDAIMMPGGAEVKAQLLAREDLLLTAAAMGAMQRAFDAARRSADRKEGGRKPAMGYQEIRYRLAEMYALMRTSRFMLQRAAWMLQEGQEEAETVAACAKVFVTESAEAVSSGAMRVMGREGTVRGNAALEGLADAKLAQAAGRSCEERRMAIADDCLKKY
jgi:alkylation response protein AidB-like acyl-CoA dehydrogenase